MIKIMCIAGARPNFIKIAPLVREMQKFPEIQPMIVHTGQHYNDEMSDVFFRTLDIPNPAINFDVGSGSHAAQTAEVMKKFEPFLLEQNPDLVVVVGDVNSTLACALVARKLHFKVAHVEAGLRSFDQTMPEEINRVLTDRISDFMFVTEEAGLKNLQHEGFQKYGIFFVGNVMIDTLKQNVSKIDQSDVLKRYSLEKGKYVLLTLHRPSNVDDAEKLKNILNGIRSSVGTLPILFPAHPRTKKNLQQDFVDKSKNLILLQPEPYIDFLALTKNAHAVFTDSGGIQEETTYLGVPCITIRENTERPVTLKHTNTISKKISIRSITDAFKASLKKSKSNKGKVPKFWDGKTSERIIKILIREIKRLQKAKS